MNREIIKKIIFEQKELFQDNFVKREALDLLLEKSKSDLAVIISGIRRCGKSVLLSQLMNSQKDKFYYFNFDDDRLIDFSIKDFETLLEVFLELFGDQKTFYFDEIQNIDGWERFVRRLIDYNNKVYITGSNANLLSKELGTRLTGRCIQIELYPASFKEFLVLNKYELSQENLYKRKTIVEIKKLFDSYFNDGGFFKYLQTNDRDFFKTLYENILYRDIITRHSLTHEKGIKDIFHYLISNISKEFSYTTLKSISGISSITTIKEYISYLEQSYLLFSVSLYDRSVKKQLVNPKKAYVIDTGLADSVSFKFSEDRGRKLENLVFLQLKRKGKEIFYHRTKKECDFVIKEGLKITQAIQVCYDLNDENKKREIDGLIDACKSYKLKNGLILTYDEEDSFQKDGIKIDVKPVWKWLIS